MLRMLLAVTLLVSSVGVVCAQDAPGRVGRLSYIEGTVSFHLGDQADWAPATVNYPVTSGESFWTEPGARAEIQIGPIELSLDQASELDVVRLDDTTIELRLGQGALNLHLWQMPQGGGISVLTPRGRVVPTVVGSYDIDAGRPNGDRPSDRVQVTVLEGAARFEGDRGAFAIGHSEAATISGYPSNAMLAPASYSAFDNWALARERREAAAQQPGYVAPAVTGYQDLNQYGSWSHDPTYGGVWYPATVPSGWAPYRYGHWAFVPPWGWTWIDDAPWGFAPFHYGRWIETSGRWGWVPGALVARPVYAPALVAFIGGDGWGISLSAGPAMAAVGWVALAPNEVYRPVYRASPTYVRNVNISNVNRTVINNITINNNVRVSNFRNRQAATVVPAAAFTRAAPIQRATVVVPEAQLAGASVARSITQLRPGAAARIGRAVPAAATASVPQPNAPATIARTRVAAAPAPARDPEPVPAAPGPPRTSGERRNAPPAPAAAAPASRQGQQTQTQPAPPAPIASPRGETPARQAAAPQPPRPTLPGDAARRAAPPAAAPNAPAPQVAIAPPQNSAPTTTPRGEAARRAPPPAAAPNAPAPQAAIAPPQNNAPTRTPPQPGSAAPRSRQVQLARPAPVAVVHPEQETHIAPTPQVWTRVPGPPPQTAPSPRARTPAPAAAAASRPVPPARAVPSSAKAPPDKDDRKEQQH